MLRRRKCISNHTEGVIFWIYPGCLVAPCRSRFHFLFPILDRGAGQLETERELADPFLNLSMSFYLRR